MIEKSKHYEYTLVVSQYADWLYSNGRYLSVVWPLCALKACILRSMHLIRMYHTGADGVP